MKLTKWAFSNHKGPYAYTRYLVTWQLVMILCTVRIIVMQTGPEMAYTVIRFVGVSAKFGTCTVVSVNGTLVEAKMCTFALKSTNFIFNKCPI
jgi:hypothetical protein